MVGLFGFCEENLIFIFWLFLFYSRKNKIHFRSASTCLTDTWIESNLCVNKILFNVVHSQKHLLTVKFVVFVFGDFLR